MISPTPLTEEQQTRLRALQAAVCQPDISYGELTRLGIPHDAFVDYYTMRRNPTFQEYQRRIAWQFWQMWKTYNDALNRSTETAFDYQRVISLVVGSLGYCKGGRPLVPGLICPHCDLDTSDDYQCPKPRRFNV